MPTYDMTCNSESCGKTFEVFMTLAEHEETNGKTICECGADAEQVILPRRNRARYAYLTEMTYFEDAKGNVKHATDPHDIPPPGFVRKSTGLINEMRKIQSRMNEQDRSQYSRQAELEQRYLSDQMSASHSEMRQLMQSMPDVYKDLARMAMEDNNKKSGPQDRSARGIDFGYFKVLE